MTHKAQAINHEGGQTLVTVRVPGPVDLCLSTHPRAGDLAVYPENVSHANTKPLAGEVTMIMATLRNQGDVTASQIAVEFRSAGVLIGMTTIEGPLVGGDSGEVGVSWAVPQASALLRISVEVDPQHPQLDGGLSSNTAVLEARDEAGLVDRRAPGREVR